MDFHMFFELIAFTPKVYWKTKATCGFHGDAFNVSLSLMFTGILFFLLLFPMPLVAQNSHADAVKIQLSWKHQFQFAGYYVAKEKGFYRDAGLDVTIEEYDHSINIVNEVVSGRATFGVGRSSLLIDRYKGKPVVALGAVYQNSPSVLVTTDPEIKSPRDLRGKRIMITSNTAQAANIVAMLFSNGIQKDEFFQQRHSFDYRDLINNTTDAMACYLSNEIYLLEKSNIPFTIFDPKDYGYSFYSDILFTSDQEIADNPKRIKDFYDTSSEGWLFAFENINETAQLIYDKYNSQKKSLESLIYEGQVLKTLAIRKGFKFGHLSKRKFREIAKVYQLSDMIGNLQSLDDFIDPLGLNKKQVKIGVLAKRGSDATLKRWNPLAQYLENQLEAYQFTIVPLDFRQLSQSIAKADVDFFITNTMYYVQMEHDYGVSRIATLLNSDISKKLLLREFGGVIFTRHDNQQIKELKDIKGKTFGAVNERSFGGWIMAYEELFDYGLDKDDFHLTFFNTHDAVVEAVLKGNLEAGTVRTDTLERMILEGEIKRSDVRIINPKVYENFPYLVSTKLYPEWPFAKLKHTSDKLANDVVSELVNITVESSVAKKIQVGGWTTPLDYTLVHNILKKLHIKPYDKQGFNFSDVLKEYVLLIYVISLIFMLLVIYLIFIRKVNKNLDSYNYQLDQEVKKRTNQLEKANKELKILAQTDTLTGICNRGFFMSQGKKYFDIALRNRTPLQFLSLDLDNFKRVNDSYGHQAGDQVLKEFTKIISELLRESDLFGRIGGEEFAVILQNTSIDGAKIFAERVRKSFEAARIINNDNIIKATVSIGLASLRDEKDIEHLSQKSDVALYRAKNSGRNKLVVAK